MVEMELPYSGGVLFLREDLLIACNRGEQSLDIYSISPSAHPDTGGIQLIQSLSFCKALVILCSTWLTETALYTSK